MKRTVARLLAADHQSLNRLISDLQDALSKREINLAFELLDLFWARLAVHIRAEHLQLFPAITEAANKSAIPPAEVSTVLAKLREDHDFFMKELARLVQSMREMLIGATTNRQLDNLRTALKNLVIRLELHNQLEEEQAYLWPSDVLNEAELETLHERIDHELMNMPPRFRGTE